MSFTDLMLRFQNTGDEEAFNEVYSHVAPRLRAQILRSGVSPVDAEDVLQEVSLAIWQNAHGFDGEMGSLQAWAAGITRNKMRKQARIGSRETGVADHDDPLVVHTTQGTVLTALAATEGVQRVLAAVSELDAPLRQTVEMAIQDLSASEIAQLTGTPDGTVRSRLTRARQILESIGFSGTA